MIKITIFDFFSMININVSSLNKTEIIFEKLLIWTIELKMPENLEFSAEKN
jgi:hypothetical protein